MHIFFFFNDTATTEIYTRSIVGSVRCVQETVSKLIIRSLEKFFHETKVFLPEYIIIYRDGLSEFQRQNWFIPEVQYILKAIQEKYSDYKPKVLYATCLLYTSPSPRDLSTSRMPSSA
eukprot:TRINITY_DN13798_c0_g1_i1.p2 TRINITY_DN13798_c0_g1~~TRINITY_DN13798_c0_g1_i1.p2  ORF type:complete len:118 (-),score=34.66 TRINITY_DN13798_c0_g1_i1:34-387(-)